MRTIVPITTVELELLRAECSANFITPTADPRTGFQVIINMPVRIFCRMYLDGDCWRIGGWNSDNGFAKMSLGGRHRAVHRVVYALLQEQLQLPELPPQYVLDHVKERCRFRDCCNPFHLEPVTVKVNTERGNAKLFQPKENKDAS